VLIEQPGAGPNTLSAASGIALASGATEMVHAGGTATSTIAGSGATEFIWSGGTASLTTLGSGGIEVISSGGTAVSATVDTGGIEAVSSGGNASATTVGSGGTLDVSYGADVTGAVLASGSIIDFSDAAFVAGSGSVSFNSSTDDLTLAEGISSQSIGVDWAGSFDSSSFVLSGDGTDVTMPCYCRGTRMLTDRGEVAVEDLCIGDSLLTMSGAARPIRWIGRRSYDGHFAAGNSRVLPIRISQGALADGEPRRDLWVSREHAVFLDGLLIPALALVNGVSIVQAEAVDRVEYFHLELETHDVIHAEGALAETFVDDDSRGQFQNALEYRLLYQDASHGPAHYCAPRVEDGEELEAVRRRILARTPAAGAAPAPCGRLHCYLDAVTRKRIEGWAQDDDASGTPVMLRVLDNGVVIAQVLADRYPADLEGAGIGDGQHCFSLIVPGGLSPQSRHLIQVQRAADGQDLHDSPRLLEADATVMPADGRADTCPAAVAARGRRRRTGEFPRHDRAGDQLRLGAGAGGGQRRRGCGRRRRSCARAVLSDGAG